LKRRDLDALVVIACEHFANFFMNNMPAICMGMAEHYEGPIEDEAVARHQAHACAGRCAAQQGAH